MWRWARIRGCPRRKYNDPPLNLRAPQYAVNERDARRPAFAALIPTRSAAHAARAACSLCAGGHQGIALDGPTHGRAPNDE